MPRRAESFGRTLVHETSCERSAEISRARGGDRARRKPRRLDRHAASTSDYPAGAARARALPPPVLYMRGRHPPTAAAPGHRRFDGTQIAGRSSLRRADRQRRRVRAGFCVVSGFALGVDIAAHQRRGGRRRDRRGPRLRARRRATRSSTTTSPGRSRQSGAVAHGVPARRSSRSRRTSPSATASSPHSSQLHAGRAGGSTLRCADHRALRHGARSRRRGTARPPESTHAPPAPTCSCATVHR